MAHAYVCKVLSYFIVSDNVEAIVEMYMGKPKPNAAARGVEIHAISCASKPFVAWIARDAIQECREACGGHGYLKASGLTDMRDDNDATITYEGEGHVIIQQTSNWLLKLWPQVMERKVIDGPYGSVNFLNNAQELLAEKCDYHTIEEFLQPESKF